MHSSKLARTKLFSEELGIDLKTRSDKELFKWFLASLLFGARITAQIAKNTYRAFERHQCLTPQSILKAGKDFLVTRIMREGGYVRYDGRKSDQILRNCEELLNRYQGSLNNLYESANDERDLENRLLGFYGVGPVTANIFLRELRPFWKKADPHPLKQVMALARKQHISLLHRPRHSMKFARIEAGLVRAITTAGELRKARYQHR